MKKAIKIFIDSFINYGIDTESINYSLMNRVLNLEYYSDTVDLEYIVIRHKLSITNEFYIQLSCNEDNSFNIRIEFFNETTNSHNGYEYYNLKASLILNFLTNISSDFLIHCNNTDTDNIMLNISLLQNYVDDNENIKTRINHFYDCMYM